MADVLLREYVDRLREQVYAGHFSEAFALGQHILHYYPKHLETYVVLAQACLETDDLAGATDLFRRVLSADPENVLALAGMALIHEAQDKLDEALWYLERAYEIQPTNDELRRELIRVRETYYGTVSEQLEMTSGALARIYARQGQYASAINEFRRLLRTSSQRYDARVALAETLYRAGRTDEAAQLAQNIMQDAPYALKPNLIVGTLWTDNSVAEGEQFLQRAQALDPEYRVARDLIGTRYASVPMPRVPSMDEPTKPSALDNQIIGLGYAATADGDAEKSQETGRLKEFALLAALSESEETHHAVPTESDTDKAPVELFGAEAASENIPEVAAKQDTVAESNAAKIAAAAVLAAAAVGMNDSKTDEPAPPPSDATLEEIARAEAKAAAASVQTQPEPAATTELTAEPETTQESKPAAAAAAVSTLDETTSAPKSRAKTDSIPTGAIAAAAAALATSLAADKMNQPAPARRTHPALPKVRPVIRSASDKLPAWLRLSATPAQASVSFENTPSAQAETIQPLGPAPAATAAAAATIIDGPDWLVQAQAASQSTPASGTDPNMPDWLRTPAEAADTESLAQPKPQEPSTPAAAAAATAAVASDETLPNWLNQDNTASPATPVPDEKQESVAALPDWLQSQEAETASAAPSAPAETSASDKDWTNEPQASDAKPVYETAIENEPPPARAASDTEQALPDWLQESDASQPAAAAVQAEPEKPAPEPVAEKPADALTLIDNARQRRRDGDIKGALDLYERAMHRRPNHLDTVIGDLQELVQIHDAPAAAHRLLGEAYAMAGRFKESLEQYRLAMGK